MDKKELLAELRRASEAHYAPPFYVPEHIRVLIAEAAAAIERDQEPDDETLRVMFRDFENVGPMADWRRKVYQRCVADWRSRNAGK